ncbi:PKD domain-containing protein [Aquimarina acroporae]|uniref:PKD domain-containing protein n=1 Tax=Aquimarina acroporae TaxID=2937283 RepID=UPI00293F1BE2|nr:PKD domain-containing protein [Aquimarina acroporae]
MKHKFLQLGQWSFCIILLGILFASCDNEEEGLSADQNMRDAAPLSVNFTTSSMFLEVTTTNTSKNARTYLWDFGVEGTDDDTSAEFAPTYTYEVEGTYTVTLTSKGDGGQEETITSEIVVSREMINPSASFTSEEDFLMVTFKDESVNATSYAWDFGDGSGTSTEASPTYTYSAAGTYTVSLTVTSSTGDTNVTTSDITVAAVPVPPTASFTFAQTNLEVVFTDASEVNDGNITAYSWDFGDGSGTSTEASPTYTYTADGDYTVTLTITFDEISGETTSVATQTVSVEAGVVTATFKAVVLNGTMDEFTNNTGDNADAWDMSPNSTVIDNTGTEIPSPYNAIWNNSDLDSWLQTNCGDDSEQPSSTSDGTYQSGVKTRGLKLNEACRRLYQVVTVEVGVEYTLTIDTRSEVLGVNTEVYILNSQVVDETDLAGNADASLTIGDEDFNTSKGDPTTNTFTTSTFTFIPTTTEVVIYVRAPLAIDNSNEVFIDNIDIITPGF